jgi:hypothetical protein
MQSELGKGSEFVVMLPSITTRHNYSDTPAKESKATTVSGLQVLLVDDEQSIISLVKEYFEIVGNT